MTQIHFYHNAPDRLALACELIGRAHAGGRCVAARLPDPPLAHRLDQMLWTSDPPAFIPHVMAGSPLAARTPVILGLSGADEETWPHTDILFNLSEGLPAGVERFRVVVEIVGHGEAEKNPARARWMQYKTRALPLKAFDAEHRVAL